MPPTLPTTSPVAVATTRILAAYLRNHRLSPAEAATLGGTIAATLADLTGTTAAKTDSSPRPAEEPAPRQRVAPLSPGPRQARALPVEGRTALELAVTETEPAAEAEAVPVIHPHFEDDPIPAAELLPAPEVEQTAGAEVSRKRKRPSRPRSRRGKGAASASEDRLGEAPDDEARDDREASETGAAADPPAPQPVAAEVATELPSVAPKPRRATTRQRRATTA